MMWGPYGMGYGFMGWMPFMGIFWLIVLVVVVAALMGFGRASSSTRERPGERPSAGLAVLDERYARGEINREEYLQKKQDITSQAAKP